MSSVISVLAKLKADTTSYVNGMKVADKATKDFQRGTKDVEDKTKKAHSKMGESAIKMGTIVKGAVLGFLTIQGGQFLKGAIQQASNFEAEAEGVKQMFGDSAGLVAEFAKNAASSAGLAETTALRFSKSFGGYAKSAGLAGDSAAGFATQMVQAAGDLGSFYDLPTESALMAIQQGLRGEYEPLRRFNILLDENAIGQKAMTMGVSKTGKNLTQQQKVLVRQQAIMDQLGVANGDFVKYADTYGNSIKTTSALFQNLQKDVGGALLPAMAKLSQAVVPLITQLGPLLTSAVGALAPIITSVSKVLGGLIPVIAPVLDVVKMLAEVFAQFVDAILPPLLGILTPLMELFKALMKPVTELAKAVIPILAAVMDALVPVIQNIIGALQPFIDLFSLLANAIGGAMKTLAPVINSLITAVGGLITQLIAGLKPIIPIITTVFYQLLNIIILLVKTALPPIINLIDQLGPVFGNLIQKLVPLIASILPPVLKLLEGLIPIVVELINVILPLAMAFLPLLDPIMELIQKLLPPLMKLFYALMPIILLLAKMIVTLAKVLIQILIPIIGKAIEFLSPIISFIADLIAKAIDFIVSGISQLWSLIEPVLNAVIDGVNNVLSFLGQPTIPKLPKKLVTDAYKQGQAIGQAFADGKDGKALTPPKFDFTGEDTGTGTGTGTGKAKNPVADFYKKLGDDIKQQKAKLKLISMGVNDDLANMIVSAGDGWEKIYAKIAKGGSKAIAELGNKFAQTAAGMQKVSDIVQGTMGNIQDSLVGAFDVSKMGSSSKEIMSNARHLVERAKAFGMEIAELSKKKLNPTLLNQVIAAGPVEGLALARSLNTSDIGELNSLYNQVGTTALDTGKAVVKNETQYIINVQGGVGDKNTIGKSIIEAIKAYERTSGASWRTS
jgi:phage-related protein